MDRAATPLERVVLPAGLHIPHFQLVVCAADRLDLRGIKKHGKRDAS
jgi:hypothetical protein